jgi:hypothetical protein
MYTASPSREEQGQVSVSCPPEHQLSTAAWYRVMRETRLVDFEDEGGFWPVLRYDDVLKAARAHAVFASDQRLMVSEADQIRQPPCIISMDPPEHQEFRTLVSQAFTPRAIAQLAPHIAAITNNLLDRVIPTGSMDSIDDPDCPLPVIVIAELLGIPVKDRPQFKRGLTRSALTRSAARGSDLVWATLLRPPTSCTTRCSAAPILPLATARDKRTQITRGLEDCANRSGHQAEGMWLAETGVDLETLAILADQGVRYTVLSPCQAAESVDSTRPYCVRFGGGRSIAVFFLNGPFSNTVSFDERATTIADAFVLDDLPAKLNRNSDWRRLAACFPGESCHCAELAQGAHSRRHIPSTPTSWPRESPTQREQRRFACSEANDADCGPSDRRRYVWDAQQRWRRRTPS